MRRPEITKNKRAQQTALFCAHSVDMHKKFAKCVHNVTICTHITGKLCKTNTINLNQILDA